MVLVNRQALYYGVRVEVVAARNVTGGIACDVRKPADATDWPWTVTSFVVASNLLVPVAGAS